MSEIIRVWLQDRLGILFREQSWDEDKGGGILATLLNSYALLTDEQLRIVFAKQGDFYETTLEVMRLNINTLGIQLTRNEFRDVLEARGTAITKLFYELFIVLQGKDTAEVMVSQKLKEPLQASRFTVTTYDECGGESEPIVVEKFNNPLAAVLADKEEVVKHHIDKYLDLMRRCKKARHDYINSLESRRVQVATRSKMKAGDSCVQSAPADDGIAELPMDAQSLNQSVTELLREEKHAQRLDAFVPDENVSRRIIASIQAKAQQVHKNRELREMHRKGILKDLWQKMMEEQEEYFKHQFTEKLQQQSLYEQKMTSSLMNVRSTQDDIAEQKRELMEQVRKQQAEDNLAQLTDDDHEKDQVRYEYYMELQRKLALHQRLYQRRLMQAQSNVGEECANIMKDILDIAFYSIDYKETYCEELVRRKRDDLARLFVAKQPIEDLLEDVTDVICEKPESSTSSIETKTPSDLDAETVRAAELDRQNALDELTFEDYQNYKWPWDYSSWMEFPEEMEMILGMNVLGHIIHRLLLGKYPKRPLPSAPFVPRTQVAACIDGFQNLDESLPILEQLLRARNILIVQMKDAITYCLDVFKKESTAECLEGVFDSVVEKVPSETSIKEEKSGKKKPSSPPSKSPKKGKGKSVQLVPSKVEAKPESPPIAQDKINQTPSRFPDEEMVLSEAAKVGKSLFELLNVGGVPNDYLSATAFVEYLKSFNFTELAGWALINYPQTIQQAIALEEMLSATRVPCEIPDCPEDDFEGLIDLATLPGVAEASSRAKRKSKLYSKPQGPQDDVLDYDTFLTAYIEMKSIDNNDPDEKIRSVFKCPENSEALCKFYQDQGCRYTLFYEKLDFPTIKQLGKLILGDYSMPPKTSEELFTDTVHYIEANLTETSKDVTSEVVKEGEKKKKPDAAKKKAEAAKKSKATKSETTTKAKDARASAKDAGKKSSKAPKSKVVLETPPKEMEDEETQFPTPVAESIASEEEAPVPPALPGEYDWLYRDLPIMPYYEEALATMWENIEEIYITDMTHLFFLRRTTLDALTPYNTFVRSNLRKFITRPDAKQKYLTDFQQIYNEFEEDMRADEEVKAELHMRIEEFRESLWKVCDTRMRENEEERVRIVQENWMTTQLMELCNVYATFLQLEANRSTDTTQLLIDYYSAMMTGAPCQNAMLPKTQLELIQVPRNVEDMDHIAPFVEFTESFMQRMGSEETMASLSGSDNPFVHKMLETLSHAHENIEKNWEACERVHHDLESGLHPKEKVTQKPSKAKGKQKENVSVPSENATIVEPQPDVKLHAETLLQEMEAVARGERLRADLRLKVLEHAFDEELQFMLEKGAHGFRALHQYIEQRYRAEVSAVEQAARLLSRAVEEETPIQPEMVLQGDGFYVRLGSLMYESPLPDVSDEVPGVCEPTTDEIFTIAQLRRIADVLRGLAPNGVIGACAFTFLLQEFLVYRGDDEHGPYMPRAWRKLLPHQVQLLVRQLFENAEYLDWRDFIIYAVGVRSPTNEDLLAVRALCRTLDPDMTEIIFEHQYPHVRFWFESDVDEPRLTELRELLFRLFSVGADRLNYTALLLAFCKDADPCLGVIKALTLSLGTKIVCDEHRASHIYGKVLKHVMTRELDNISRLRERTDINEISREVVEQLIDDTIHATNSVVLRALEAEDKHVCIDNVLDHLQESPARNSMSNGAEENTIINYGEYVGEGSFVSPSLLAETDGEEEVLYQVTFDVIANVFTVALPWLHKIKFLDNITFHERFAMLYNSLINEDIRDAFVYQIFADVDFQQMVRSISRFYDRCLIDIVRELIECN